MRLNGKCKLAVLSGSYVLPLVPHKPRTDIERDGQSFKLVRRAIEERCFVGVKLYPPMGFRPLGNNSPVDTGLPPQDQESNSPPKTGASQKRIQN